MLFLIIIIMTVVIFSFMCDKLNASTQKVSAVLYFSRIAAVHWHHQTEIESQQHQGEQQQGEELILSVKTVDFFPQTVSITFFWKKRGLSVFVMAGFRMAYLLDPVGKKHHGRHDFVNVGGSSKQQRLKENDAQFEICSNYNYNNTISHRLQNVNIHPHFNRSI